MSVTPKRLILGSQLTGSAATYYTATGVKTRVDALALTNTTSSAVAATVYLVPSGGSAGVSNCVLSARFIGAGETFVPPGAIGQWIDTGGTIQAFAGSAAAITLVASGVESTS